MDDEPTTEAVIEVAEPVTEVTAETEDTPEKAELKQLRAALAKANKQAESNRLRLKADEDAKLPELEKARKDAAEATQELTNLRRDSLRQKVALDAGLSASWVGRLQGDTEEELAADAASILADLNKTKKPEPDPSQGARQTAKVSGRDAGKAEAARRFGLKK